MPLRASGRLREALAGSTGGAVVRSSAWVLAGAAFGRAVTLVASLVVARLVVPADFGKLSLMQTAVTLLSGLAGMGLGLAVSRQLAEARTNPELAGRYLGSVLILTAAGSIVVSGILVAGNAFFAGVIVHDAGLGALVTASVGAVAFLALNLAIQSCLIGLEQFRLLAAAQLLQGIATAGGLVAGAALGKSTGALLGFSAGQALSASIGFVLLRRHAAEQNLIVTYRPERIALGRLWRFGVPSFAAFLVLSSALLAGQVILSHQRDGYAEVAIFSIAYRWHLAIVFTPASVGPVLIPVLTRLGAESRIGQVFSIFRGTMWATLALTAIPALVVAGAGSIVLGFSGSFYTHHKLPLIILAVAAVPAALNNVLSSTSISLGAMKEWLISDIVLAVVLIGLTALLVGNSGATGLAIAYLAGYIATDLALAGPLRRRFRASMA